MNQWRTRSQHCPKGGAWITGSWPVKATSGWQLQAASYSPRHSPAGTVASLRNRALGTEEVLSLNRVEAAGRQGRTLW